MRIGVIGCGNVGYSTLVVSAEHGNSVVGLDPSPEARDRIWQALGGNALALHMSDLLNCDMVFICVPTDPDEVSGQCDLSPYRNVILQLSALIPNSANRPAIIQRSTCPPGTAREMSELAGAEYGVCPSFLTKMTLMEDARNPPRIAYAGNRHVVSLLDEYHKPFGCRNAIKADKFEVIELLKYIENATDAVLISLWNEFLLYGLRAGVNIDEIIMLLEKIGDRPRFASSFRVPGGAFGKWCLVKDLRAFAFDVSQYGTPSSVLGGAIETNERVRKQNGENPYAYYDLLSDRAGKLCLTETARQWLRHAASEIDAHDIKSSAVD